MIFNLNPELWGSPINPESWIEGMSMLWPEEFPNFTEQVVEAGQPPKRTIETIAVENTDESRREALHIHGTKLWQRAHEGVITVTEPTFLDKLTFTSWLIPTKTWDDFR